MTVLVGLLRLKRPDDEVLRLPIGPTTGAPRWGQHTPEGWTTGRAVGVMIAARSNNTTAMKSSRLDMLSARQDLLCLVLIEIAKFLPAADAQKVARGIEHSCAERFAPALLTEEIDQAIAADLALVLQCLQR